ncbi:MAG TPA: hypothetical protein VM429_01105 [Micropruina sp.]|nr:hypothetical protein [Micropruina sp.]
MRAIAVAFLAVMLTACSTGGTGQPALSTAAYARGEQTAPTTAPSRSSSAHPGDHHRSLTPQERSLATAIAKREQSKVIGTFIGATAFVTQGTPFDRGSDCDVNHRFLNIRLVWKADANFTHSHPPNSPPDGPRKDLLMTVDQRTHDLCETGAGYRNVGAAADETLLYGEWPSKADG